MVNPENQVFDKHGLEIGNNPKREQHMASSFLGRNEINMSYLYITPEKQENCQFEGEYLTPQKSVNQESKFHSRGTQMKLDEN